jgi:hypothetical protein
MRKPAAASPLLLSLAAAVLLVSCDAPPATVHVAGHSVSANGIFGGADVRIEAARCKGLVPLKDGAATVMDNCFSGESNVVLCSNISSTSGVRCTPRGGVLEVEGSGNDVIAYARLD